MAITRAPAPTPLPPPPADIDFTRSDFWSAVPHSARWIMATRAGETRECASQIRTIFRALKRALGRDPLNLAWTAADSTALHTRISRVGTGSMVSIPFTPTQTVWTPEMMGIALWYAFGRSIAVATGVFVPARSTMPHSSQDPPQDGSAWTDVTPSCWSLPAVEAVVPSPPPPPPPDTFGSIDWSMGDFWSAEPYSARWLQTDPAAGTVRNCAMQARSLLRLVKSRIAAPGYVGVSDSGVWTAEYSDMLVRAYLSETADSPAAAALHAAVWFVSGSPGFTESNLPFTRTTVLWTSAMLRYAIAAATGVLPSQIELPATVSVMPQSNVIPPSDGINDVVAVPRCTAPRSLGTPPPSPPGIPNTTPPSPVPGPGGTSILPAGVVPTLWGSSTCSVCAEARVYLGSRGIQYRYVDIAAVATQPSWQAVQRRVAAAGLQTGAVPVLELPGSVVVGFTPERYDQALGLTPAPPRQVSPWLLAAGIAVAGVATFFIVRAIVSPAGPAALPSR